MICSGADEFPSEADYQLVIGGCEWALSWAEFQALHEEFDELRATDCVAVERALREFREGR